MSESKSYAGRLIDTAEYALGLSDSILMLFDHYFEHLIDKDNDDNLDYRAIVQTAAQLTVATTNLAIEQRLQAIECQLGEREVEL